MPDSTDVNVETLVERIGKSLPEGVKLHKSTPVPFAFGLTAIEILVVMKDAGGLSDQTEHAISQIPGIQSVETLEMSLI